MNNFSLPSADAPVQVVPERADLSLPKSEASTHKSAPPLRAGEQSKPFDDHLPVKKRAPVLGSSESNSKTRHHGGKRTEKRNEDSSTNPEAIAVAVWSPKLVDLAAAPSRSPTPGKENDAAETVPTELSFEEKAGKAGVAAAQVLSTGEASAANSGPVPAKTSAPAKPTLDQPGDTAQAPADSSLEKKPTADPIPVAGTDVAKQQVRMSNAELETKPASQSALTAEVPTTGYSAGSLSESSAAGDFSSGSQQRDSNSFREPEAGLAAVLPALQLSASPSSAVEPSLRAQPSEKVSHLFNEVTTAMEKMRTDGQSNVEIKVSLNDGESLTIRLQMLAGEIRTTFKTQSGQLQEAIARGWSEFSSSSVERGLRVTTLVFEPPSAQSHLNDPSGQPQTQQEKTDSTPGGPSTPASKQKRGSASLSVTPIPAQLSPTNSPTVGLSVWA